MIDIEDYFVNPHAVNCWPEVLECDGPISSIIQIICLVVNVTLKGLEAIECKCWYLPTICWLPITTV